MKIAFQFSMYCVLISTLSLLCFFSFDFRSFILSSLHFFRMSSLLFIFTFLHFICVLSYLPSLIFLRLNELLPSSHISFFLVSLPFHFSVSFFFVFFVISLFHSSLYYFSFFIIIFFTAFSPLCFSSANPLSFFYFLFSVLLLLFFCPS